MNRSPVFSRRMTALSGGSTHPILASLDGLSPFRQSSPARSSDQVLAFSVKLVLSPNFRLVRYSGAIPRERDRIDKRFRRPGGSKCSIARACLIIGEYQSEDSPEKIRQTSAVPAHLAPSLSHSGSPIRRRSSRKRGSACRPSSRASVVR